MGWLLRQRITWLMMVLWAATGATFFTGSSEKVEPGPYAGVIVLLITAFKARIVMLDFMEARSAPNLLRWGCEGWIAVVTLLLVGFEMAG